MISNAVIRGFGYVIPSMLVGLAQPLLLLGALLTMAHWLRIPISSTGALLLNFFAGVGALGAVLVLRRHFCRELVPGPPRTFLTGEWFGTATQMMLASVLVYLQGRTGVISSGLLLDTRAAGLYAAIERLADVALLGLVSVNMIAAQRFAALYAQRRWDELQRNARLAAWGASGFMLATVLPLALFGKPILRLFGDEFVSGYPLLLVLLGGVVVNATCGSVGYLLSMTGHQRDNVVVALISLGLNVTLCMLLIPSYGVIGAAVANALSIALWNITMLMLVRQRLGIWACIGPIQ
jgi:O-antigen/teichoic acid export membrane protein